MKSEPAKTKTNSRNQRIGCNRRCRAGAGLASFDIDLEGIWLKRAPRVSLNRPKAKALISEAGGLAFIDDLLLLPIPQLRIWCPN
jgi:hypothetical protein